MAEKKLYEMSREERLDYIRKTTRISDDIEAMLRPLSFEDANRMVENAIGIMSIPMGIATNFVINGREFVIPMAIEEPSVIAAVSKAAKIAKVKGGFIADADDSLMIGQVQIVGLGNVKHAKTKILRNKKQLLVTANSNSRSVTAVDLQVRQLRDKSPNNMGNMLMVELIIDTKDAMGANAINTMCEAIAPHVAEITGGEVVLKILSNYATRRMVRCRAIFDKEHLGGSQIVKRILYAYALAYSDAYRAVTHNKGVMNGIDAVALATGQDFRAIEAGAHAYAARDGTYRSLTSWRRTKEGDLAGGIELPLAVGVVGGIVNAHPTAKFALQILGVKSAKELAMVIAATGLAQNLAAIRALSSEGIQTGHMRLHARKFSK
ncbi:MAG TPA: hydroxymethylglutaryl-CoA reductase, degradative [Nitrososphaera sp.]|nr:hydroxymethylglutaryl-CoA reductase, degradative [Nitrososphaera sp.]